MIMACATKLAAAGPAAMQLKGEYANPCTALVALLLKRLAKGANRSNSVKLSHPKDTLHAPRLLSNMFATMFASMSIIRETVAYLKRKLQLPPVARKVLDILPAKWSTALTVKFLT
jgi:hypothetical protein